MRMHCEPILMQTQATTLAQQLHLGNSQCTGKGMGVPRALGVQHSSALAPAGTGWPSALGMQAQCTRSAVHWSGAARP
jgi:hypothetical protein